MRQPAEALNAHQLRALTTVRRFTNYEISAATNPAIPIW
jgi:hypothetical protein